MQNEYDMLYRRGKRRLIQTCGSSQEADVEDLVQKAAERFLEKGMATRVNLQKGTRFALLCGVQDMIVLEMARAKRRCAAAEIDADRLEAPTVDPAASCERSEMVGLLGDLLHKLSDRQRVALMRIRGSLFGSAEKDRAETRDYVIAHRAIVELRRRAKNLGWMEG